MTDPKQTQSTVIPAKTIVALAEFLQDVCEDEYSNRILMERASHLLNAHADAVRAAALAMKHSEEAADVK